MSTRKLVPLVAVLYLSLAILGNVWPPERRGLVADYANALLSIPEVLGSIWQSPLQAQQDVAPLEDEQLSTDETEPGAEDGGEDATAMPQPTLTIGDDAPPLTIANWFRGDEVGDFEKDQVYVVEFWATWCGPCRDSMPHLSKLQEEYGDRVTFIGISDEKLPIVKEFFKEKHDGDVTWDEVVTYRIALDEEQATSDAYLRASAQLGIPASFIVGRDGKIEWIGHPLAIDKPLQKVVEDEWDREAALAEYEDARAKELAQMVAFQKIQKAMSQGDADEALKVIDGMLATYPDESGFMMLKLGLLLQDRRSEEAQKLAELVSEKMWDQGSALNELAWNLATSGDKSLLNLALRIAERANELTEDQDASTLDTVARVHYELGDLEKAIAWQEKAVAAAGDDAGELQDTLEAYQRELEDGDDDTQAGTEPSDEDESVPGGEFEGV